MFNKFLKKGLCYLLTKFRYLSIIFLICIIKFSKVYFIVPAFAANATAINNSSKIFKQKLILDKFFKGKLEKSSSMPRGIFINQNGIDKTFDDFKHNLLIVVFWASWSLDSVNNLNSLQQLENELKHLDINNVKLLPISIDFKDKEKLSSFLKHNKIELEYFIDSNKSLMSELGIYSLPSAYIISADGNIIYKFRHHVNWANELIVAEIVKLSSSSMEMLNKDGEVSKESSEKEDDNSSAKDIIATSNQVKKKTIILR
jgi:peroxiredoxin